MIVIGQRSVTDWLTAVLAIVTAALLWRFKKLPEPLRGRADRSGCPALDDACLGHA